MLLIKNPAGANEAIRTLLEEAPSPGPGRRARTTAIADGRDVSWIWDVDFEPLLPGAERIVVSGARAAELALRFVYGGFPRERLDVVPDLEQALDQGLSLIPAGGRARRAADLHRDAVVAGHRRRARPRAALLGAGVVMIRVGHLYPDYLNIYADRGNIAVLAATCGASRPRARRDAASAFGNPSSPVRSTCSTSAGGQDREQALVAPDLAAKGAGIRAAVEAGAALLAVCGGYQLLGRGYRGRDGSFMPGAGLFPHETIAGERRMIGDVLLECELEPGVRRTLAGFENHAGRTRLDPGAEPLGRVVAGFGNDGESGYEGCRVAARSAPTSTGRCCPAIHGWPTGCWRGRSPTRRARSHPPRAARRRAGSGRRTPSPRAAHESAARRS